MTKTTFLAAIISAMAFSSSAQADVTFEFEGKTWTAVGVNTPLSANHMFPGAANACPSLKVRFEKVKPTRNNGGPTTREQKNRGGTRHHVVCIR